VGPDAAIIQRDRITHARVPGDFVIELTHQEVKHPLLAFTEHCAIMVATVLNSPRAVQMTVLVVRAFVKMREGLLVNAVLARDRLGFPDMVRNPASRRRSKELTALTTTAFDEVVELIRDARQRTLWRMRQFFEAYRGVPKPSTLLRELPWSSNLHILTKTKQASEREFYLRLACTKRSSDL